MRLLTFGRSALLLVLAVLAGCDSGDSGAPDARSLTGDYTLVRYGGAPLPSGGVSRGSLRLEIEETIPVYRVEWVHNGARIFSDGLYTVTGRTITFQGRIGTEAFEHSGVVEGDRITLSLDDGTFTTFTFGRN